jgi:predicted nuclease of predicted toxin-antitoxin system
MKLLLDMNLSPDWVQFLSAHDIDAVHWASVGDARAEDREIASYALDHGCVVVTQDLDFGAILAASDQNAPSVIQIRSQRPTPERAGTIVVRAVRQLASELTKGALITVDADRVRVSMLPLVREG